MACITYMPVPLNNSLPILDFTDGQPRVAGIYIFPSNIAYDKQVPNNTGDDKHEDDQQKDAFQKAPGSWSTAPSSSVTQKAQSFQVDQRIPRPSSIPRRSSGSINGHPSESKKKFVRDEPNAVTPLYKTRLCNFHANGACRNGSTCSFAHGSQDLRASPDFAKTSVCPVMLNFGKCDRPSCRYAHRVEELKTSPNLLKTKMCSFFLNGVCVVGEACRFAHSAEELREAILVQKSSAAGAEIPKNKNLLWELRRQSFTLPASGIRESRKSKESLDSVLETENMSGPAEIVNSRVLVNINGDDDALPITQSSSACPNSATDSDSAVRKNTEDLEEEENHATDTKPKIVASNAFIAMSDPKKKAEEQEGACSRSRSL